MTGVAPPWNYAFQCLTFDKNYQATMRFVAAIGVTTILIQNHKISQRRQQLQHFVKKAIGESAYNFFLFISSLSKQPRKTWQHWKVHDKLLNLIMKSNQLKLPRIIPWGRGTFFFQSSGLLRWILASLLTKQQSLPSQHLSASLWTNLLWTSIVTTFDKLKLSVETAF